MTTILKRIRLKTVSKVSDETKGIAREAQVILRHHDLALKLGLPTETLAVVLQKLSIKPFTRSTVDRYKQSKREELGKQTGRGTYSFHWNRYNIGEAEDVPAFVLRKAMQIKLAAPDAKLFIEQLENHPDPFLIAKLGREEYYVEVWDEKEFEARL